MAARTCCVEAAAASSAYHSAAPLACRLRLRSGRRSPIHVLIAEDDPDVRSLVLDVVKELGHAPSCAANGADALALYDTDGADVVVSDWLMPRMDGVQLCRRVRSRVGAPYTYFILLTALGDSEHRIAGMQAGADDYLEKPFNLSDIEARLIAAERVTVLHRRREALLRLARRFAAETDADRLLDDLLREAIELLGGSAGVVTRWDDESELLVAVHGSTPALAQLRLRLGEGACGRAAQQRVPVLVERGRGHGKPPGEPVDAVLESAQLESAIAVPLVHDARLVGTLSVGRNGAASESAFTQEDAQLLEMLASTAAAALVGLEHARLDGVLLAARTAQHELNNQLAVARGYAEMLAGAPDLPPHLHEIAEEVMNAADDAAGIVRQLRSIAQIREQRWNDPSDSTINLSRSQH
ncbi:MAG: response regulator [Chloroflexi bacterium]|nr:MAG: response regulator [Chloroflexota bacterium]